MAKPDQRDSIFDKTPAELAQWRRGDEVSAAHLNAMQDRLPAPGVPTPEQINRGVGGTSLRWGLVRGWPTDAGDVLDMSIIKRKADGTWAISKEVTGEFYCSPGLRAIDFLSVRWVGIGGLTYPLDIARQVATLAQPIAGTIVLWLPSLVVPANLPANLPVTDGYVENGAGEVGFAIAP